VLVAIVATGAALGAKSLVSPPSTTAPPSAAPTPSRLPLPSTATAPSSTRFPGERARSARRAALGEAGGALPSATTAFDDELPGIGNLNPALLRALRRATTDAGGVGVEVIVNSGWRSPAYEDQLRHQAIAKYGSEAQAARWVATGATSPHVSGDAVDIGPADVAAWMSAHGAAYGLCQIYRNESWHFELRPGAADHGCPAMYDDPTRDPRMQK
jgi:hypothetical protein